MGIWRYRCIRCGEDVREIQAGQNGGWIRHGAICRGCTRKATAEFWGTRMINAPCADCKKEGRDRIGAHTARNGDSVCNTHFLQRMRVSAPSGQSAAKLEGVDADVLSALVNLGYDKVRAERAIAEAMGSQGSSADGFDALLKVSLWALKNPGVPNAAAFLSDPEAIERDHAARTGQPAQSVHRRPKLFQQETTEPEDEDQELDTEMEEEQEEDSVTEKGRRQLDIDWAKVQQERNGGTSVADLAEKYGVHITSIYAHTKVAVPGSAGRRTTQAAKHAARATEAETRRTGQSLPAAGAPRSAAKVTGGNYDTVLADLREKRERLNMECTRVDAAIEALEAIA
jgi:RuvA, C-terminal domain